MSQLLMVLLQNGENVKIQLKTAGLCEKAPTSYTRSGIMFGYKNIGFNGKFYTFPYFLVFLLNRFIAERK